MRKIAFKRKRIKAKDEMLVSYENFFHDVKTPLAIMFSYMQMMDKLCLPDEARSHMAEVKKNWYRVNKLIKDANDRASINRGTFIPKIKNHDIVALVGGTVKAASTLADRKSLALRFCPNISDKVMAVDKNMIDRILLNLLTNSIKYTPPGGEVSVSVHIHRNRLVLTVADTGPGIPSDIQTRISQRGVRAPGAEAQEGSGLGLSIVKELAEVMGGEMTIRSDPSGTQVSVRIPVLCIEDPRTAEKVSDFASDRLVQIELSDLDFGEQDAEEQYLMTQ